MFLKFSIKQIDAVIVTHAHLDHQDLFPCFSSTGTPVYCTSTRDLMVLLQLDYIVWQLKKGKIPMNQGW